MNKLTEHFFTRNGNIFTATEVAATLEGSSDSRYGLVKRALAQGEIFPLRRGVYCLAPKYQKKPLNPFSVAQRLYGPSYISFESALAHHGWIPEAVYTLTSASYKFNKEFTNKLGVFSYRKVPQRSFFQSVERKVDQNGDVYFMASPIKALCDYVYLHRMKWTCLDQPVKSLRISPELVSAVPAREYDDLIANYDNTRVRKFLSLLKTEVIYSVD